MTSAASDSSPPMANATPRLLEQAGAERVTLQSMEQETLGIDHCQAGEWLATEWQLPGKIVDVIRSHHTVNLDTDSLNVPYVVTAACRFSEALGFGTVAPPTRLGDAQALDSLPPAFRPRATRSVGDLRAFVISRINLFA